jgi:hypothetical protein
MLSLALHHSGGPAHTGQCGYRQNTGVFFFVILHLSCAATVEMMLVGSHHPAIYMRMRDAFFYAVLFLFLLASLFMFIFTHAHTASTQAQAMY